MSSRSFEMNDIHSHMTLPRRAEEEASRYDIGTWKADKAGGDKINSENGMEKELLVRKVALSSFVRQH